MNRLFVILALAAAGQASAADLVLTLTTPSGAPVIDAVASAYPGGKPVPVKAATGAAAMTQRDLKFVPFVLAVTVGTSVVFPNQDRVKHQVYSFSPPKKFSIDLYGKDQTRSILFDKAGVVAIGCNIHDSMVSFIRVLDTASYGQSNNGTITLRDLPAGETTIRVWHPYQRAPGGEQTLTLTLPAHGTTEKTLTLKLRTPPTKPAY